MSIKTKNSSDSPQDVAYLDFSQQRQAARTSDGWLQGRYYSTDGLPVAKYLSFDSVFDICPFEVGSRHSAERRAFREAFARISRLLELEDLLPRAFQTLSNGEMRRVLFARALLGRPKALVLNDPMAGLDPRQRERFRRIIGALAKDGVEVKIRCPYRDEMPAGKKRGEGQKDRKARERQAPKRAAAEPVVELRDISIDFGRRKLFDGFSWTIRRGEHWVLKGPNGSGKSTLMALVTGDSPLAYANDVRVFGVKRGEGELAEVRRRIGVVSPEMQTYSDCGPEELLEAAFGAEPELLILDEPCLNLSASAAKRQVKRIAAWLAKRPAVTAICIAHREDHVPPGFPLVMDLGARFW